MPTIDFDAFRGEQKGEPFTLKVGGKIYTLPPSLPAAVALEISRLKLGDNDDDVEVSPADAARLCESLFGPDLLRRILNESGLGLEELPDLADRVLAGYMERAGAQAPNRETRRMRSRRSRNGLSSKRTSSASTRST